MKKKKAILLFAAGLFLIGFSGTALATILVAEWNFNQFTEDEFSNGTNQTFDANEGVGTLLVHGPNALFSSDLRRFAGDGTLVNAYGETPAGGHLALSRGERWDDGFMELQFSTLNLSEVQFSYAFEYENNLPPTLRFPPELSVQWSVDGGVTYTTVDTIDNTVYEDWTAIAYDFSSIAALNNQPDARIRLQFGDGGGVSGNVSSGKFDNIVVTAVPEPATVATLTGLLAFALVLVMRRRAQSRH